MFNHGMLSPVKMRDLDNISTPGSDMSLMKLGTLKRNKFFPDDSSVADSFKEF